MIRKEFESLNQLQKELGALKKQLKDEKKYSRLLDELIALLPGHVYWLNTKNEFLGCNNLQAKSAGLSSRKAIVGKTNFDMPWKEQAEHLNQINNLAMQTGQSQVQEECIDMPEGPKIYLSHKVPLRDEHNEVIGVLGVSLDISQMKEMEVKLREAKELAEAANKAKLEFLDNMRHDIRTPLSGIVGFADLLKQESNSPQVKEYVENLVASSHALHKLLDEVLEAIRVGSGEIPRLKKKFNLKKSLQHIIDLNRAKAAHKRLKLTLDVDDSIPEYVIGDQIRVHRIALELIANALNFTDTGFVSLSVHLMKRKHRELIIKLVVEDSGIGIPKDKQQEIYGHFTRLTPSYQGIYKGAGLGLSVVKQFVDEVDGEIYVESVLKKGSKFTFVFPLNESLLNDALGVEEEPEYISKYCFEMSDDRVRKQLPQALTSDKYRVLLVEDNSIARQVAQSILGKLNCDTELADTGKKAVDLWSTGQYDLIFMDVGLPDCDGYEVTHKIRIMELVRDTHIPIIALTAHAGDENTQRCIEAGMNAVLMKPLTVKSCSDILEAFIPGYPQQDYLPENKAYSSDLPKTQHALFDLSKFPHLDSEAANKALGNEALLVEMLSLMLNESLPEDLALLKAAYADNNWDEIQNVAHKIKGGAVYVGTVKIKMACQYLERYWKTGQHDLLESLYQQAIDVIEESMNVIQVWLNTH